MRILIDGQALQTGSALRGIGRYVEGLIEGLGRIESEEIFVILNGKLETSARNVTKRLKGIIPDKNIVHFFPVGNFCSWNCLSLDYFISQQIYLEAVRRIAPDAYIYGSAFEPGQQFVLPPLSAIRKGCIVSGVWYDGIPLNDPQSYLPNAQSMQWYLNSLGEIDAADIFLCISDYCRQEIEAVKPYIKAQTVYGASFSESLPKLEREEFIFYCGGLDPRKNVKSLALAYSELPEEVRCRHLLKICCRKESEEAKELRQFLEGIKGSETIELVEANNNEELARLYATCWLFVFPSLCEGLGLTVIEAMNYETPVLSSSATSLKEVWDLPEGQFDPKDTNQLTKLLLQADKDKGFYERLCKYSAKRKGFFTWEKTARSCLAALRAIFDERRNWEQSCSVSLDRVGISANSRAEYELAMARQHRITWYVDLSEYLKYDLHTGIHRLVDNFIRYANQCTQESNIEVVYIAYQSEWAGYRILMHEESGWSPKGVCTPSRGDCYIGLDFVSRESLERAQITSLSNWKDEGVRIFLNVPDSVFPTCRMDPQSISLVDSWLRFAVATADCVVTQSEKTASDIGEWASKSGINHSELSFALYVLGSDASFDSQRGENRHFLKKFVVISEIEFEEDIVATIKAFAAAIDAGADIELKLVGHPSNDACDAIEQQIQKQHGDRITWERDCATEELQGFYKTADCIIQPSPYELGGGMIEAFCQGLPILLRDSKENRCLAEDRALYFSEHDLSDLLVALSSGAHKPCRTETAKKQTWGESVGEFAKQVVGLLGANLAVAQKNMASAVSVRSISELAAFVYEKNHTNEGGEGLREQARSAETAATLLPFVTTEYYGWKNFKFAVMRKIALTRSKREHYNVKWRLLRQKHAAEQAENRKGCS